MDQQSLFDDLTEDQKSKPEIVNHIVFILDHSGSMGLLSKSAVENYNEQIAKIQSVEGQTNLITHIDFADNVKIVASNIDVSEMKRIRIWRCNGWTALYDAVMTGINCVQPYESLDDGKDHAFLFIIITDGKENNSKELRGQEGKETLQKLIKEKEATERWTFTFLGGGLDVDTLDGDGSWFAAAGNRMSFNRTVEGYKGATIRTMNAYDNYFDARKKGETQVYNFYRDDNKEEDQNTRVFGNEKIEEVAKEDESGNPLWKEKKKPKLEMLWKDKKAEKEYKEKNLNE